MTEFPKLLPTESVTSKCGLQRLPYANTGPTAEPAPEKAADKDIQQVHGVSHSESAPKPKASPLPAPKAGIFGRARAFLHREKPSEPKI